VAKNESSEVVGIIKPSQWVQRFIIRASGVWNQISRLSATVNQISRLYGDMSKFLIYF